MRGIEKFRLAFGHRGRRCARRGFRCPQSHDTPEHDHHDNRKHDSHYRSDNPNVHAILPRNGQRFELVAASLWASHLMPK
jgi:hypothetical protein